MSTLPATLDCPIDAQLGGYPQLARSLLRLAEQLAFDLQPFRGIAIVHEMSSQPMVAIYEYADLEALESLRLPWTALAGSAAIGESSPTFDQFYQQWAASADSRVLKVLSIVSRRRVIGILPLAVNRKRSFWKSIRTIEFAIGGGSWTTNMIGRDVAASYLAAMRYFANQRDQWDAIRLGPFHSRTERSRCQTAMQWAEIYCARSGTELNCLVGSS